MTFSSKKKQKQNVHFGVVLFCSSCMQAAEVFLLVDVLNA